MCQVYQGIKNIRPYMIHIGSHVSLVCRMTKVIFLKWHCSTIVGDVFAGCRTTHTFMQVAVVELHSDRRHMLTVPQ